jgi:hypothetical protein
VIAAIGRNRVIGKTKKKNGSKQRLEIGKKSRTKSYEPRANG